MIEILILFIIPPFISFFGTRWYFKKEMDWSNRRMIVISAISLIPVWNWMISGIVIIYFSSKLWESSSFSGIRDWLDKDSKV